MSRKAAPRGTGDSAAAEPTGSGAKPKGRRGKGSHGAGAGVEDGGSHSGPADTGGKGRGRGERKASSRRAAGEKENVPGRAAGDKENVPGRAAGDKGIVPGRAAGDKGIIPGRAAGDKENVPGRAAGDKENVPGRAAGDKGIVPGRAAGDKGIVPGRAAGDKGIVPGRAAGEKENVPGRAAGDKGIVPGRAAGDKGIVPGRAAGDKGIVPGRAAGDKGIVPGRAAGDKGIVPGRAAGDKGIVPGRAAGDKGIVPGRAAGDKGNVPGRAAGDKGIVPGRAAGDKGIVPGRAAGDEEDVPGRAAGDEEDVAGRAAGDEEDVAGRAAGVKGIVPGRAAGDKGIVPGRAAGDKGIVPGRAAGDEEDVPGRAAGDEEDVPGRAAGDEEDVPGRAAGDEEDVPGRAAGDEEDVADRAAGVKGIVPGRAAGDKGKNASGDVGSGSCRAAGDWRDAEDGADIRAPQTGGSEGAGDLDKLLRTVLDNLRIRSDERSKAARLVNEVVEHLLLCISKDPCFTSIKKLTSGSYYENVKISEPNEFDIMITVPVARIEYKEADFEGAFYQVVFKRCTGAHPLAQFVCDGMLSAEKMLCQLRNLIKAAAKSLPDFNITVKRKKSGSPAVTLEIEEECAPISLDMVLALEVKTQSWPPSTTEGLKIEKWLGNKVRSEFRREPFYLVPKQQPLENLQGAKTESQKEMWRISFSHIEKKMIKNHGNSKTCCENKSPKCCRKSCLKLLKNLIQKLKEKHPRVLACVCSYHAKTTLLHACVKRPKDDMWQLEDLADCFLQLLADFTEHLRNENLPHFFIPSYNLFDPRIFDPKSRIRLLDFIEKERTKNFPIFGVNLSSQ